MTGRIHYRVSNHMNVLGGTVWQKKPIFGLKVGPVPNGLLDHRRVITRVLRVQPPRYLHGGWWRGARIEAEDPVPPFLPITSVPPAPPPVWVNFCASAK